MRHGPHLQKMCGRIGGRITMEARGAIGTIPGPLGMGVARRVVNNGPRIRHPVKTSGARGNLGMQTRGLPKPRLKLTLGHAMVAQSRRRPKKTPGPKILGRNTTHGRRRILGRILGPKQKTHGRHRKIRGPRKQRITKGLHGVTRSGLRGTQSKRGATNWWRSIGPPDRPSISRKISTRNAQTHLRRTAVLKK